MKRILLVLVLIVAVFAGCIGEKKPSAEEIMLATTDAVNDLDTYRYLITMDQAVKFSNLTGMGIAEGEKMSLSWAGAINLTGKSTMESSTITLKSLDGNQSIEEQRETYHLDDMIYQKLGENWTRLQQPYPEYGVERANQAKHLVEMLNRSEMEGVGWDKVDGVDCYKLEVHPDDDTSYGIMVGQIGSVDFRFLFMINLTELFTNGSEMDWTVWIAEDTYQPVRSQINTKYMATADMMAVPSGDLGDLRLGFETDEVRRFYDYNEPLMIAPPEEAMNAPLIVPLDTGATA